MRHCFSETESEINKPGQNVFLNLLLPLINHKCHLLQLEDKTLFHEEFVHYLKYAMIVYKREPAVENVIEFVAKFAASFQTAPKTEEEEEEEDDEDDDHPFLSFIFNFLLEVLKHSLCRI